ncbi:hypothetical protein PV325_003377 [Microctonus aethiopoides]|nr:hypothetical protein PV325_003377 [Microctonus aethiopoides]
MIRRFVEIEVNKRGKPIKLNVDEKKRYLKENQLASENFKLDLWDPGFYKETFMKHLHTAESKLLIQEEIEFDLQLLSKYLHGYHGKPVYVFIEEFDVPVNTMVYGDEMSIQDRKQTIKLSQVVIGNLLKDNKSVERSLSNVCQQLGGILSGSANNVQLCAFIQKHPLVEFYDFKEFEVKETSCIKLIGYDTTKNAAEKVFTSVPYEPSDVDVELHDYFSANGLITGGLFSNGRPLGATVLAQCLELSLQLRGEAGRRQGPGAKLTLQYNIGLGGVVIVVLYKFFKIFELVS